MVLNATSQTALIVSNLGATSRYMAFVFVLSLLLILYLHLLMSDHFIHEDACFELIAFIKPMIGYTGRLAYFIAICANRIIAILQWSLFILVAFRLWSN